MESVHRSGAVPARETCHERRGEHESLLRLAFEQGKSEYGVLPLSFEAFAQRVIELGLRRLCLCGTADSGDRVADYLAGVAGADLFLATACEEGVPGAWEEFTRRFVPRLFGLGRRYGASRSEAEEIARSLPGDVALPPGKGGARTRLGNYDGTGNLLAWLAVQVARRVADRARARHTVSMQDDVRSGPTEAERLRDPSTAAADPAEISLSAETASRLEEGFQAAWARLEPREARALILRFRDDLPLREVGPRLGTSLSQASRIVAGAVEKIRIAIHRRFSAEFPGRWEDADRLWDALRDAVVRHMQKVPVSCDPPLKEPSGHGPATQT